MFDTIKSLCRLISYGKGMEAEKIMGKKVELDSVMQSKLDAIALRHEDIITLASKHGIRPRSNAVKSGTTMDNGYMEFVAYMQYFEILAPSRVLKIRLFCPFSDIL